MDSPVSPFCSEPQGDFPMQDQWHSLSSLNKFTPSCARVSNAKLPLGGFYSCSVGRAFDWRVLQHHHTSTSKCYTAWQSPFLQRCIRKLLSPFSFGSLNIASSYIRLEMVSCVLLLYVIFLAIASSLEYSNSSESIALCLFVRKRSKN